MKIRCPECGSPLSTEMVDVNMCWNCGCILDPDLACEDVMIFERIVK